MSKTKLENNMEAIFDLPEAPPMAETALSEIVLPEAINDHVEVDQDAAYARDNLYKLIESGQESLEVLMNVARASESPRAFEVVQQFMKTLSDANKDLLELQRKKKVLKSDEEKAPKNVTNALFVGSTAELQKMIKNMK
jgi:hypothetical protein